MCIRDSSLGAKYFVRDLVKSGAEGMQMFLPAIVFLIGCLLAFATGTSLSLIHICRTEAESRFYNTAWSLLPPLIAITLALITKEVYSSLFRCV